MVGNLGKKKNIDKDNIYILTRSLNEEKKIISSLEIKKKKKEIKWYSFFFFFQRDKMEIIKKFYLILNFFIFNFAWFGKKKFANLRKNISPPFLSISFHLFYKEN